MFDCNRVVISGRLVAEPELTTSRNGTTITKFRIANNCRKGSEKHVNWINCVAFGKTAEIIEKYAHKGQLIIVDGKLDISEFTRRDTGENVRYTSVVVNNFTFAGNSSNGNGNSVGEKVIVDSSDPLEYLPDDSDTYDNGKNDVDVDEDIPF